MSSDFLMLATFGILYTIGYQEKNDRMQSIVAFFFFLTLTMMFLQIIIKF